MILRRYVTGLAIFLLVISVSARVASTQRPELDSEFESRDYTGLLSSPGNQLAHVESLDVLEQAMLRSYIHGVTRETAVEVVTADDLPALIRLLSDPQFPRRDNIVAFLGHVGGGEAAIALQEFLQAPPVSTMNPIEDRAMLLIPRALGRLAARCLSCC